MTDHQLVLRALRRPERRIPSIALAASLAALPIVAAATADAKQQCSATAGPGSYWSWRIIDGRKCWYEGKPMLSKALLEWPAQAARPTAPQAARAAPQAARTAAQPARAAAQSEEASAAQQPEEANAEPPSLRTPRHGDPMDAQAKMRDDASTFDALWRSRIEKP